MATKHLAGEAFARHKKRSEAAWAVHDQWQKTLIDAYDYVAPYRMSTLRQIKAPNARADLIFDPTAVMAHVRSTGRLQQGLFPTGEAFFTLELGPAAKAQAASNGQSLDEWKKELELVTDICNLAFQTGEFDAAANETCADVLISTGFMMVMKGDVDRPLRFTSASMDEVAIDEGPYGSVHGIFWKRKWAARAILEQWPKGNYPNDFMDAATKDGTSQHTLCQDVVYDDKNRRWLHYIYLETNSDTTIAVDESRECPWITPRYFRMPGQVYGFGPVLMTLPTTKSLNKAMEITLRSAALAMLGIFTRVDDGVFNPDTARIEPGAIWTVARNGGPLGPSISRLPPAPIDVSNIILQDLRMQVQSGMQDQQLPPDSSAPRSAAEIISRVKALAQDHAGAYGRLVQEMVIPLVKRALELLYDMGALKGTPIRIDQLLVKVKVISPLGMASKMSMAEKYLQWVQMMQATDPTGGLLAKLTPADLGFAEVGEALGIPAHLIYDQSVQSSIASSVKALAGQAAAAMAQAQKQAGGPQAPPPANGDPAQGGAPPPPAPPMGLPGSPNQGA
ncbi:MAG: hypothetical protein KGQ37_03760 [Hyphomicrobiales bacterium]|nr:hypothetical protein [Hyphomicrobiales bacterium]